jgi:molybdopterin-guanine dinucleotide biosynthesis protein A
MGGCPKALLELDGKAMLQHVIDRVTPQVDRLLLSVETALVEFEVFGLPQVPDPEPGSRGPLGGLAAALRHVHDSQGRWLLLVPCDAPFLPADLARVLCDRAETENTQVAVASYRSNLQPTFSVWHRDVLEDLESAVNRDRMAGFKQFLRGRRYSVHEWPVSAVNPFFNINDPCALEDARKMTSN